MENVFCIFILKGSLRNWVANWVATNAASNYIAL